MNCEQDGFSKNNVKRYLAKELFVLVFYNKHDTVCIKNVGKVLAYFFACIYSMSQQQARIKSDAEYEID